MTINFKNLFTLIVLHHFLDHTRCGKYMWVGHATNQRFMVNFFSHPSYFKHTLSSLSPLGKNMFVKQDTRCAA